MPRRLLAFLGILAIAALLAWFFAPSGAEAPEPPEVGGIEFEIVTTSAERARGLGGRTEIPEDYGMLFVFPDEGTYGFWMKDMLVSIDILWLTDDGTVLGIEANVSPATYPASFYPPIPVRYVLEMAAGEAAHRGLSVGSRIALPI